jgi:hypothetical protein
LARRRARFAWAALIKVEAAGIELCQGNSANLLMAHDFHT